MTSARLPLAIACALLFSAAIVTGSPAQAVDGQMSMTNESWAAIRFNLTPLNDLTVHVAFHECRNGEGSDQALMGDVWWRIEDGHASITQTALSMIGWAPGSEVAELGVEGTYVRPSLQFDEGTCGTVHEYAYGYALDESLAIVMIGGAQSGVLTFDASWTTGVTSYDTVQSQGVMRTKAQLDRGVYASTFATPGSAGAFAGITLRPNRDFLGWFAPGDVLGASHCSFDQFACANDGEAFQPLESKGPHIWNLEIPIEAGVGSPYYAVGGVFLPTNDYLAASD